MRAAVGGFPDAAAVRTHIDDITIRGMRRNGLYGPHFRFELTGDIAADRGRSPGREGLRVRAAGESQHPGEKEEGGDYGKTEELQERKKAFDLGFAGLAAPVRESGQRPTMRGLPGPRLRKRASRKAA